MAEALVLKSTTLIKKESTYGVDPTVASGDAIETSGSPTFGIEFEEKERNVIRNTKSQSASVRGIESTSGEIAVELKGSGTTGTAPDDDVLYECAIGVKNTTSGTTTHGATAATTTSIPLVPGGVTAASLTVKDAVLIGGEVSWVTAIATDTLTVSPALSTAPGLGASVGGGVHYKLSTLQLSSFWAEFWRGDITHERYGGNVIESMSMNFAVGEIIIPSFKFQGQKSLVPAAAAYGLGSPTYDTTAPLQGLSMIIDVGASSIDMSSLSFEKTNTLFARKGLINSGISKIIDTKRKISGSFSTLYESKAIEDVFRADTKSEMRVVRGTVAGNIMAFRLPKVKYLSVPKGEESDLYKYDVNWVADLTLGEDEMSSFSFL